MIRTIILVLAVALAAPAAYAEDFAGQFTDPAGTGAMLVLKAKEDGSYAGSLSMDGESVPITATADGDVLAGEMSDGFMSMV
jgi:hypothetical protein